MESVQFYCTMIGKLSTIPSAFLAQVYHFMAKRTVPRNLSTVFDIFEFQKNVLCELTNSNMLIKTF